MTLKVPQPNSEMHERNVKTYHRWKIEMQTFQKMEYALFGSFLQRDGKESPVSY